MHHQVSNSSQVFRQRHWLHNVFIPDTIDLHNEKMEEILVSVKRAEVCLMFSRFDFTKESANV
jgi:hypothetical protein